MQGIRWRRLKLGEMEIELAGLFAFCVNEQRPNADLLAHDNRSLECVLDERCPQTPPLLAHVNAQAREKHNGHGVVPSSASNSIRAVFLLNGSRRESVVANYPFSSGQAYDIHSAGSSLLCLERMIPQPISLSWRSAVELFRLMRGGKNLNSREVAHASSSTAGDSRSRRRRGRDRGGASKRLTNSFH